MLAGKLFKFPLSHYSSHGPSNRDSHSLQAGPESSGLSSSCSEPACVRCMPVDASGILIGVSSKAASLVDELETLR